MAIMKGVNTEPEGSEVIQRDTIMVNIDGEMVEIEMEDDDA